MEGKTNTQFAIEAVIDSDHYLTLTKKNNEWSYCNSEMEGNDVIDLLDAIEDLIIALELKIER